MWVWLAIIIILIIILILFNYYKQEHYENPNIKPEPFIKLYERYNQKNLIFDFEPLLTSPDYLYLRKIVKANIKSIDLNIPLHNDGFDDTRTIEIWNIYDGNNTASSESDFYNPYTEANFARRANSAKYKLLLKMNAGNRIKLNLTEPVKRVFIYARF